VDIPDKQANQAHFGDPNDPKTWEGPWIAITNPQEIAEVICDINAKQYHQAHSTPFGFGHLAQLLGHKGDSLYAQDLINGTLPQDLPHNLVPETLRILHTLAHPTTAISGTNIITEEDFVHTFKNTKESTSSSPSGRHIGHYKAAIKDPFLVQLHSTMMSLPF
jgi:hypothetical protein